MNEQIKKYLSDVLFSIHCIDTFVENINFEIYQNDIKTKSAVER